MTAGGGRTITWDLENRPTQITYDGNTTSYVYDGDGKRVKKTGAATTFAEGFQSSNANWTYSAYQTVPYVDNGQYTIRSIGTNASWDANFYRNAYSISSGNEVRLEFKLDATNTIAHFSLENDIGGYRRWGVNADAGKIYVQYNEGAGWVYPQDLINPIKLNTWYVVILRVDDANGFKIDVHERDNPSVVGTYTRAMPTGYSWRFHHWIWRNAAYIANYVERKVNGGTTIYVGNLFEKNTSTGEVTKYYYAEGRRIAMRKVGGSNPGLSYLLSDHLGSTVGVVDSNGGNLRESLFYSFGGSRLGGGGLPTDKQYTGQQLDNSTGLYFYGARYYDASLGRFISPDTLVQNLADPQALNRYSYTRNNPLKYVDPSGHFFWVPVIVGGAILIGMLATPTVVNAPGPMGVTKPADELAPVKGAVANMPVSGDVNDVVSVVTGKDQLTGEELSTTDRMITGGAAALPVATGPEARGSLKAARKGAQYILPGFEGLVRKSKDFQIHHLAAHENKKWSSQFERIASKYGLDLDGDWNKVEVPQLGSHPDAYHDWVYEEMRKADRIANGDKDKFLELFNKNVRDVVVNTPDMLDKDYWR